VSNHHRPEPESYASMRARALEALLVEKGIITTDSIDAVVQAYEDDIGPRNGARVVARAWVDPEFKARLLQDGRAAVAELGLASGQGAELLVVENTPDTHNLIVCTLCSCYPAGLLGLPPKWYKDFAYRSRAVIEPRSVLSEFGTELPQDVQVRVWDSTAELRYMVLPERPAGTDGLSEDELVELVSRDSMIGVVKVPSPAGAA
jgi:nitrile hydratase